MLDSYSNQLEQSQRELFDAHAVEDGGAFLPQTTLEEIWLGLPLTFLISEWTPYRFQTCQESEFNALLGYCNQALPNGACSQYADLFCMSLTTGLAIQLQAIAQHVLSYSDIFPELSTPESDVPYLNIDNIIFKPESLTLKDVNWIDAAGLVMNPSTFHQRCVFLLYSDMLRIAWHHEIYHALLGHLPLQPQSQQSRMVEFTSTHNVQNYTSREIHAMEHHADHAAVGSICYRIINQIGIDNTITPELSKDMRMGIFQLAAAFICLTWSLYADANKIRMNCHPSPRIRYLGMQSSIRQILHQNGERERFLKSTAWSFEKLALLTHQHKHFSPLASLASKTIFDQLSAQRHTILDDLEQLKPKLFEYAFQQIE